MRLPPVTVDDVDLDACASGVRAFEDVLSADELARAHRFYFALHRKRFVACRAVLRLILGRAIGEPPGALQLRYGPFGKPELAIGSADVRFNVSHAGARALIAVARGVDVGIDLEPLRPMHDAQRLARSIFSDVELRRLEEATDRDLAFLRGWTRKEAYGKALGIGLADALRDFTVPAGGENGALVMASGQRPACRFYDLDCPGHVAALAVCAPEAAIVRRVFDGESKETP